MALQELTKKLQEKNSKLSKSDINQVVEVFSKSIVKALINKKNVELRGFGTFFVKKIKEKFSSRNPRTGKLVYVPEKNKVRFRASKKLKALVNK